MSVSNQRCLLQPPCDYLCEIAGVTGPPPIFEIHESRLNGRLRLSLSGQLDLASTPVLEDRLARLRALRNPVSLDLSRLDFIDSTGLHLLIREFGEARVKRWELQIERDLSHQLMRLFKLVHIEHLVRDGAADPRPADRERPRPASPATPSAT